MQFCTCHDSTAVVACAKLHCDQIPWNIDSVFQVWFQVQTSLLFVKQSHQVFCLRIRIPGALMMGHQRAWQPCLAALGGPPTDTLKVRTRWEGAILDKSPSKKIIPEKNYRTLQIKLPTHDRVYTNTINAMRKIVVWMPSKPWQCSFFL